MADQRPSPAPLSEFLDLVEAGGGAYRDCTFAAADPHHLLAHLESRLVLDNELCAKFVAGAELHLQDIPVLQAALVPMQLHGAQAPGDSFVRLLLSIGPIQADVARFLLELLAALAEDSSDLSSQVQKLILGQFRWLNHVVDPQALTDKVLEVMPVCSQDIQKEIICLLPELVQEGSHEAVLNSLEELANTDSTFIIPILEALSNMPVTDGLQERTMHLLLGRLACVEATDLPLMVQYLLQASTPATAKEVVAEVREVLHFKDAGDPRMQVLDGKQKGRSSCRADSLEVAMVKAIRTGLLCSPAASDAWMRCIRALTAAEDHRVVDMWVLLLFHASGTQKAKATEAVLRKKLAEASPGWLAWLRRATSGHEAVVRYMFPTLLTLAQALTGAGVAYGCDLYTILFVELQDSFCRSEVLRCLHAHLGVQTAHEVNTAVRVFLGLAHACPLQLGQYAAFVTAMMDHLDTFTPPQLHQVFEVLSELVVSACDSTGSRSCLEDELHILLRKQLSSADTHFRQIGIIGTVALVARLAYQPTAAAANDAAVSERRSGEAEKLLEHSFHTKDDSPECFALLCDELACAISKGTFSPHIIEWLWDKTYPLVATHFTCAVADARLDRHQASAQAGKSLEGQPLLSLDEDSPLICPLLPLLSSSNKLHSGRLLYGCASLHLLQSVMRQRQPQSLRDIDGLLGCPMHLLPPATLARPDFAASSAAHQDLACRLLFVAISWLRELVSTWAMTLQVHPHRRSEAGQADNSTATKLVSRLLHVCQLEALLTDCLAASGRPVTLPVLGALPAKPSGPATKLSGGKRKAGQVKACQKPSTVSMALCEIDSQKEHSEQDAVPGQEPAACALLDETRLDSIHAQLRPLHPAALKLLASILQFDSPQVCMPAAGHLLADLRRKLQQTLIRRRAPFAQAAWAHMQQSDCGVEDLLSAVAIVLPALRTHLDNAASLLREDSVQEGVEEAGSRIAPGEASWADLVLQEPAAAQAALAPLPAARRLLTQGLECLQILLTCDSLRCREQRAFLYCLLAAFGGDAAAAAACNCSQSDQEVALACGLVAVYFEGLTMGSEGYFDVELALVRILAALRHLATALLPDGPQTQTGPLAQLQGSVSRVADAMLQQSWHHCPASRVPGEAGGPDAGWKGRTAAMAELLRLHIQSSTSSICQVQHLVQDVLSQVPCKTAGKQAHAPVDPYAALSGSTLVVWCRVLWAEVLRSWDGLAKRMTSAGRFDSEEMANLLADTRRCAQAFAGLVQLSKDHPRRNQVAVMAAKTGSQCIDTFLKTFPVWQAWLTENCGAVEEFVASVKEIQKGTRLIQIICSEAKARKDLGLSAKVPSIKRSLEKFIFAFKGLSTALDLGSGFSVGALKHKDMSGQVIPSQLHASSEEDDDEDDDDMEDPFHLQEEDMS